MDVTAEMVVVGPARRAAVRGLALVVARDRAPGRDPAVHLAVVPSRVAAPSPRMDRNRRQSSPALVPLNATPNQSPVRVLRKETSPARALAPNPSVARTAVPSRTTTSPDPVLHGIRTRVRDLDLGIVPIRKTSEISPARCHPKTMTTRPIETTKATKIKFVAVFLIRLVRFNISTDIIHYYNAYFLI